MAVNWYQELADIQDPGVILKLAAAIEVLATIEGYHFDDDGVLVPDEP